MNFPSKIPVMIPWSSLDEVPKTVGGLVKDEGFLEFVDAWKRELHGSDREKEYLQFLMTEAGFTGSETFSVTMLRRILDRTIELVIAPAPIIKHPVPAFELLCIVDGFSGLVLKSLPKSAKHLLDKELTGISGSVIIFAVQAFEQHFQAGSRLRSN